MKNKICAIHQPNFFPWLGYFDKIKQCDKFIILDDVQFQKNGGNWSNRVAINIQNKSSWITAPVKRKSGVWNINETLLQDTKWRIKLTKTIQANYAKTPYYKKYKDFVFELINFSENNLAKYNLNAIRQICELLGIDIKDKFILSSHLNINTSSNQLLIDLTKKVQCDTYMAGGGADSYQDIEMFKTQGINFVYQNFNHTVYTQYNSTQFIKGLSVIDYIFNVGKDD